MNTEDMQTILTTLNIRISYIEDTYGNGWHWRLPSTLWSQAFPTEQAALHHCIDYLMRATRQANLLIPLLLKYTEIQQTKRSFDILRKWHELDDIARSILAQDDDLNWLVEQRKE